MLTTVSPRPILERSTDFAASVHHVYKKWTGAHWILAALADIGYPPGDESLIPIVNQVSDLDLAPDAEMRKFDAGP